jgi:two-component system chemotaxis response regulator CheV
MDIDSKTKLAENNQLELLCFKLTPEGTMFSVNVFKVRETVKYEPLTDIPGSDNTISGLLTLRNQILPVVNLTQWLYNSKIPLSLQEKDKKVNLKERQIIICEFNRVTIGILVYKAEYILRKNWNEIMVPVTSEFGSKVNNYTRNKAEIIYIVDIETMLSDIFPEIMEQVEHDIESVEAIETNDKLILIAEDSKVALKGLVKVLDRIGSRHKAFGNGRELLNYLEKCNINDIGMIITDLEMPIASGFTVIKEVKSNKRTAQIPIVVNSSMSGESNVNMAQSLNADGFMAKTSPREIADFVYQFMSK